MFVASGVVIGLSALAMSWEMAIGGASETAATTLFALLFLFALGQGFLHIRRRELAQHREWRMLCFCHWAGGGDDPANRRFFFATSRLTHVSPQEFFGTAFWLGFTLHLIAAEAWVRYTREMRPGHSPLSPSRMGS